MAECFKTKTIAIVATLDTKGEEVDFIKFRFMIDLFDLRERL